MCDRILLLLLAACCTCVLADHPPIVTLAYSRGAALERFLHSLDAAQADRNLVWIFQDGHDRSVEMVVSRFYPVRLVRIPPPLHQNLSSVLTSRLTHNYKFMLDYAFSPNVMMSGGGGGGGGASHVIVMEDDLVVALDTVDYFTQAAKLLDRDNSLFCVSSYNDNAFSSSSSNVSRVLRGEHFMALGWMTSKTIYDAEIRHRWMMDSVWDTPWAMSISSPPPHIGASGVVRECVYPEVPRTSHPGDPAAKGGALTTSRILQRLHFDHIRLSSCVDCGVDYDAAVAGAYEMEMRRVLSMAVPIKCPQQALHKIQGDTPPSVESPLGVRVPVVMVIQTANDTDDGWDVAMGQLGFFGRGPGLDRLPRGIHKGCVRSYFGGRDLLFLGSHSPYRQRMSRLRSVEGVSKDEILECAVAAADTYPTTLDHVPSTLTLAAFDTGAVSCGNLCASIGGVCNVDAMVITNNCAWMGAHNTEDQGDMTTEEIGGGVGRVSYRVVGGGGASGASGGGGGCDGGCGSELGDTERELGAIVHAPSWRSDTGECMVASWAAISCDGVEPPSTSRKYCACQTPQ